MGGFLKNRRINYELPICKLPMKIPLGWGIFFVNEA
jgi:hypothetical protein